MRTQALRDALVAIQAAEPHHRKVGSKDKYGPVPIDEVCRRCPSRRPCLAASIALADMETKIL